MYQYHVSCTIYHVWCIMYDDTLSCMMYHIQWFMYEQIELQAKLLNYFLGSNKSNINQNDVSRMTYYVCSSARHCTWLDELATNESDSWWQELYIQLSKTLNLQARAECFCSNEVKTAAQTLEKIAKHLQARILQTVTGYRRRSRLLSDNLSRVQASRLSYKLVEMGLC